MITTIWAVVATVAFVALAVLHFRNPYPLIQIPDHGHRLFVAPAGQHETAVELLRRSGMEPYGTFNAGVCQTLFRDGFTVIASGADMQKAAISIPVNNPEATAQSMRHWLAGRNIAATVFHPPVDKELKGKLAVLQIPSFGWEVAYRLTGRKMPSPKWEK